MFTTNLPTNGGLFGNRSPSPTQSSLEHVTQQAIVQYLGEFFRMPGALLAGMAKEGFLLSGSRAAEVFFEGSSEENSDFDFYVDPSARCVGGAINVLTTAGVTFEPPYQRVLDILTASPGDIVEYYYNNLEQLRRILELPDCPAPAVKVLQQMTAHLSDKDKFGKVCRLESGVYVHMVKGRSSADYGYSTSLQIITGSVKVGSGPTGYCVKVQLIFAPGKSALDHIFDFYATSVQAMITGFGAIHLYSGRGRKALYWPSNTQHQKSAGDAMRKYSRRGYSFELCIGRVMSIRQLDSRLGLFTQPPLSKVVLFTDLPLSISPELYTARQDYFKTLVWMEHKGETILLSQPTMALRDVLAAERRKRVVRCAHGIGLGYDGNVIRTACLHSVFFRPQRGAENAPHHRYPDEIVGL